MKKWIKCSCIKSIGSNLNQIFHPNSISCLVSDAVDGKPNESINESDGSTQIGKNC